MMLLADSGKSAGQNGLTRSALSTASGSMIALVHGKFYPQVTPGSPGLSFLRAYRALHVLLHVFLSGCVLDMAHTPMPTVQMC